MLPFPANPTRLDPYKNFKFRVYFAGRTAPVAGVSKVTGLKRTTEVVEHREGGDPSTSRRSPGRSSRATATAWAARSWSSRTGGSRRSATAWARPAR